MPSLQFSFDRLLSETIGMSQLAGQFLETGTERLLEQAAYSLTTIRQRGGGVWQIPQSSPLVTISGNGYQAGKKGGLDVYGTLSFIWEMKKKAHAIIEVTGKASTLLKIFQSGVEPADPIVCWKIEMGDDGSPGCRFHVQIPTSQTLMDVPRLPSILVTPAECLDFLLGELFQESWMRHQESKRTTTAQWREYIQSRMAKLLDAKAECVRTSAASTPWMFLKAWNLKTPELEFDCD